MGNSNLTVDERTLWTCLEKVQIYARSHNIKGMVLSFNESGIPTVVSLMTEEAVCEAMGFKED